MGLRIQTNMASISAQKVMSKQQTRAEHASMALASGSRIVHAGDDAAGLAISENIRANVRGMQMARMNSLAVILQICQAWLWLMFYLFLAIKKTIPPQKR